MKNIVKVWKYVVLLIGVAAVIVGLYGHYYLKRLSFQIMLADILFFGAGIIMSFLSIKTNSYKLLIDPKNFNRKQQNILALCCISWGICCLLLTQTGNFSSVRKVTFYIGFIFFGIGGLILLFKKPPSQIKPLVDSPVK